MAEVFNTPRPLAVSANRPKEPGLKMRQCEYQGRLWFLTRWMDLMRGGEWYTALTLEDGGEKLRVEMHPLEFQLLLPTLPWVHLIPADAESASLHAARNSMRQARG